MKTKLKRCEKCNEETLHDIGKKQAHRGETHHIRRSTSRCRKCGTREIVNRKTGRIIISGKNLKGETK